MQVLGTGTEAAAKGIFRIAEKETVTPVGLCVIAVQVKFDILADTDAGIDKQQNILSFRAAKGLYKRFVMKGCIGADPLHPVVNQGLGIGSLVAPGQRVIARIFKAEIGKAIATQGRPTLPSTL